MKFVTNTISTKSKVPTLSEMFKAAKTQAALSKTASAQAPVREAGKGDFGGKKAPPFGKGGKPGAKEEETEIEVADEKKKPFKKAESEEKAEKSEKSEKGGASDEAESSGQLDVEPLHQKGESTQEKPGDLETMKTKEAGKGDKKSDKDEAESSGQLDPEPLHQKGESTQEKPGDLETMKKKESAAAGKKKTAGYKKVAELTTEEKEFLRANWSNFWPKKFIDAILSPQ